MKKKNNDMKRLLKLRGLLQEETIIEKVLNTKNIVKNAKKSA